MRIKSLLILLFTVSALYASAQEGGLKGKVVSRNGRMPVESVKITINEPGRSAVVSDFGGNFSMENLPAGDYALTFEAMDFEPLTIMVKIDDRIKDINSIVLVPNVQQALDDAVFAEFDTDSANDAQSLPTSLSASKDLFNNIASYKFSEMRFNVRGYDSQYSDVYMNGIQMNDAMTSYTPWSLWSGLNDATRNQEATSSLVASNYGLGGIGGTTNINSRASQVRKGFRASLVNGNQMYRFRAMVTYGSGMQDNGWAYAFSLSTRQGGNSYIDGVYYNAYGYFAAVEKVIDERHRLALTVLGAPTERGAQQAATQEAYDLVGNNYYNPNWGYQMGKKRNARVRDYHEPIVMLNYTFDIDERSQLNVATSFRFGNNGYSAMNWFDGPDPRPDYYRNLPSYYLNDGNPGKAAQIADYWERNLYNIRHFDWDDIYRTNYDVLPDQGYGRRANTILEERHTDQRDWNLATSFAHIFRNNSRIIAGLNMRVNKTHYYDEVKDLLGGDYFVNIDKFAERDFGDPIAAQNDMEYYLSHGNTPQTVRVGDKFSYNYNAHVMNARLWLSYNINFGNFGMTVGGEAGYASLYREGLWQKGLFPDNSKGKSDVLDYFTYKLKGNFSYKIDGSNAVELNAVAMQNAPTFQNAFISPRTRNSITPGIKAEKIYAIDASYNLRYGDLKARVSGYYTKIKDQSKVISFYDDVLKTFTNFAMSGMDEQYLGLEAAVSIPIYNGLALNGAVSYGQFTYTNNPKYIQMADNNATPLSSGTVYWQGKRVESTPQTAVNVGLSYRGPHNIFASVDFNYYNNMYLSMNPLYRTDEVLLSTMTSEQVSALRNQEKFSSAYTLNASIGKNWYIQRKYTIGFSLEVKNILNNQDIKTGGYEQMRVRTILNSAKKPEAYVPFDSKYFYMFGTTYYLNIYFRF